MPDRTVLVVDDSAFMRQVVSDLINELPGFRVVGTARNGADALRKVKSLNPDIVTLDIQMPEMDGLEALRRIMAESPRPVVMLSAASERAGDEVAIQALELGAVEFVRKPSGPISLDLALARDALHAALEAAASANMGNVRAPTRETPVRGTPRVVPAPGAATRVVVVAASTGGPRALTEVLSSLPAGLAAAVLVVQHMPPGFTRNFAARLDQISALRVEEVRDGEPVRHGRVYIAPGGHHLRLVRKGGDVVATLDDAPPLWGVRPSADPLFASAADLFGRNVIGVILTGMGRDGAEGLRMIRAAGGIGLVQDQASSIIFGMPQAALLHAGADRVVSLTAVASAVTESVALRAGA